MSRWITAMLVMWLAGGILVPASGLAMTGYIQTQDAKPADGILVKFKNNVSRNSRLNSLSTAGSREMARFRIVPGLTHAQVLSGQTMEQTLQTLRANPNVEYAEPNYMVTIQDTVPDDPQFGSLYGLNNTGQNGGTAGADIDAPQAWDIETGSRDIVVAVIDTGVDYTHDELKNNMWVNVNEIPDNGIDDDGNGYVDDYRGWDFANNDNDPMDDHFHGTHVSGTIAAEGNNGIGVSGINWRVRIMPLKFLTKDGNGSIEGAIAAIEYAASMGAQISNNSWGGSGSSQALHDAIANAEKLGHLFVAAAANDGQNNDLTPKYPASYDLPNIIAVAATDNKDNLASFSNYGVTAVDLGAPGVDILSLSPGNGYRLLSGTSMATPHVSGVAALILAHNPGMTYAEVKATILNSVDPVASLKGKTVTGGRLNAFKALQSLQGKLNITPARAQVAAGANFQFTADGGTPPYTWSVSNTNVASIDSSRGVLVGSTAGSTKVLVTDASGSKGSTTDIIITKTTIAPRSGVLAIGQTLPLTASGGTAPYTWSSSDSGVAVIDSSTGVLTGVAPGKVQITAMDSNGVEDTSGDISVVDTTLTVQPNTAIIGVGEKVQFSVSGGTPPYSWSTTQSSVATIDNNGVLIGAGAGNTKVSVTDSIGSSGLSQNIEVRNIRVTPNSGSIQTAETLQLSASGGSAPYQWSVSNPNVASVDASGLLTGLSSGTVSVTATDAAGASGTSGAFTVEGSGPPQISPRIVYLNIGQRFKLQATGGTPPYSWSTGSPAVVSVDSSGTLIGTGVGSTFIGLRDSQLRSDSIFISVKNMRITPATATVAVGQTQTFTVSGGVGPYRWTISNTTTATISSQGILTAHNPGSVVVTALDQYGVLATTGTITITDGSTTPPPPTPSPSLVITPNTGSLMPGQTLQFTASGGVMPYSWSSSNINVATVNNTGVLTARAAGSVMVTVTDSSGATATTSAITVQAAGLSITPNTGSIAVGATLQFSAGGGTAPYYWSVSNVYVASVNSSGLLTGRTAGNVTVTVIDSQGHSASSGSITITNGGSTGLTIQPNTAQLNVGQTLQFSVNGGNGPYFWSTTNAAVARIVSNTGLLTAAAPGTTQVKVWDSLGASVTSGTITVNGTLPSRLAITPNTASLTVGDTAQFTASGGTQPYTWSSLNSTVASVNSNGLVTAKNTGYTSISVRDALGQSASTGLIFVTAGSTTPPPGSGTSPITITPNTAVVPRGSIMLFTASGGRQPYSWNVSDSSIGTVGPTGYFQANYFKSGTTTITITDANGDKVTSGTIEVQ